jgi:SAM-dependent methyltransferase
LLRHVDSTCALTATDLNDGMIDIARARVGTERVRWQTADAAALPFPDGSFDVVVSQFGVMFFPDKVAAAAETRRVLRPGGLFLFNVWGTLDENAIAQVAHDAVARCFTTEPPSFYKVPFGYADRTQITADLRAAGFADIGADTVDLTGSSPSAEHAAIGLVQGSPIIHAIRNDATASVEEVTRAVADAIRSRYGAGEVRVPMRAHVFSARR